MNCKHGAVVVSVAVALCACGEPPPSSFHEVHLNPLIRKRLNGAVVRTPTGLSPAYVGAADAGQPTRADATGYFFTVPRGPALFRYAPQEYVYSDAEELSPCVDLAGEIPWVSDPDGGVPFDLTLVAPSNAGDLIHLSGPTYPFLIADAGALDYRRSWSTLVRRFVPVTLSYLEREDAGAGFSVHHTTAVADAGVMDEANPRVTATFVPLGASTPVSVDWNADELAANQAGANTRAFGSLTVKVLRDDVWLAWIQGPATGRQTIGVSLAAAQPTHVEVWTNSTRFTLAQEEEGYQFSFALPWNGSVSIQPPGQPPREVELFDGADGKRVRWTAPATKPGAYRVSFVHTLAANSSTVLGTIFTGETEVPVPALFAADVSYVEVEALTGGGIDANGCVTAYRDQGAPWSQFLARSP
ncbi:MAG: hypothetical protein QM817_30435 [Archangium sp.]